MIPMWKKILDFLLQTGKNVVYVADLRHAGFSDQGIFHARFELYDHGWDWSSPSHVEIENPQFVLSHLHTLLEMSEDGRSPMYYFYKK
jgi:hypothetical protein